jgi:hypothetical protein
MLDFRVGQNTWSHERSPVSGLNCMLYIASFMPTDPKKGHDTIFAIFSNSYNIDTNSGHKAIQGKNVK